MIASCSTRRSGLLLLVLLLGAPLFGCTRSTRTPAKPQPFVFRALNLRQQDAKGRPSWELTSPEARYDLQRRVATAREPRGVIYAAGKPRYRIQAGSGTVINDGEVIQLEGKVSIVVIGPQGATITGDRIRWTPARSLIEITGRPVATDRSTRLTAERARFLIAEDKLELRGSPRLLQPGLNLLTREADWYPPSGYLKAAGPVLALRQQPGKPDQRLTASALEGNTREQVFDGIAPVQFLDPAAKTEIAAGRTRWNLEKQWISSAEPFTGRFDRLSVRGKALEANLANTTAFIPAGCDVRQPGEWLQANVCQWNWTSKEVQAQGAVRLERKANRQITRSEALSGRVDKDGTVEFVSPGARVFTELTVPPPAQGPARKRPPVSF